MVGVVFRSKGLPIFHCLSCCIRRPMLCSWWFRWAAGHNAGHQGELRSMQNRGPNSDEVFLAMMTSGY